MSGLDDLERKTENLRKLLIDSLHNHLSHKALADWCYEYCDDYWSCLDIENEKVYENDKGLDVAMDTDAQWKLYLVNTYTIDELQSLDFLEVKMPQEWLIDWMNKLI